MGLVKLGTYGSVTEANLVRARLDSEGIEAIVQSDDAGATTPTLVMANGAIVLVRESDRADALEILERMLPAGD